MHVVFANAQVAALLLLGNLHEMFSCLSEYFV